MPAVGSVDARVAPYLPYVAVDADCREVEPVSAYLLDLVLGDVGPLTCRSYGFGLLRWHRLIWFCRPHGRRPRKPRSQCWWAWCGRRATRSGSASRTGPLQAARVSESEDWQTVAAGGLRAEHDQPQPHRGQWFLCLPCPLRCRTSAQPGASLTGTPAGSRAPLPAGANTGVPPGQATPESTRASPTIDP